MICAGWSILGFSVVAGFLAAWQLGDPAWIVITPCALSYAWGLPLVLGAIEKEDEEQREVD